MPNLTKMDGNWILTGDFLLDGKVVPKQVLELKLTSVAKDHFTGTYVRPATDKSKFDGHIYTSSRGTAVSIVQSHAEAKYYCAYAACAKDDVIIGAWFDLVGQSGDFKLERKKAGKE
jgi:hypothetical protein